MSHIRYLTAGESHGPALAGIVEGVPAGLKIDAKDINDQLRRRQMGYGRGQRMQIENDEVRILSGIRHGLTLGSPIALLIENRDWSNWQQVMAVSVSEESSPAVTVPRPGHADLAGAIKYGHQDIRNVLERASARETAMRVALGTIARKLLQEFDIKIVSHVLQIKDARCPFSALDYESTRGKLDKIGATADKSPVRCVDEKTAREMITAIDEAKKNGDSVGGVFEVIALGVPAGLGSYVHWDRRLDGRIAQTIMSIPAVKAVELGNGITNAGLWGSQVHDEIFYTEKRGYYRKTNNAGGLEGGVTNGEPLVIRGFIKPIPTLVQPLNSVDMRTKEAVKAHKERSDTCVVPAASVVAEAVLALVLADAFCEKYGGDSLEEMKRNYYRSHK